MMYTPRRNHAKLLHVIVGIISSLPVICFVRVIGSFLFQVAKYNIVDLKADELVFVTCWFLSGLTQFVGLLSETRI